MVDSPLQVSNPIGFPIDYTAKDFSSFKAECVAYLKQKYPEYSDFVEGAYGIMILELIAFAFDKLSFYEDRMANETYIDTIRERRNMLAATRLIGYKMTLPSASSVDLAIVTEDIEDYATITIAKGTPVISQGGVRFEIAEDVEIIATDNAPHTQWQVNGLSQTEEIVILARQGQSHSTSFAATGLPFQAYKLSQFPVIAGSIDFSVGDVPWTQVDALVLGNPEDADDLNIFEVLIDEQGVATIHTGDGVNGGIPAAGVQVDVDYRVGGGADSNVPADAISTSVSVVADGVSTSVTVTNPEAASGGSDAESIEHARFFAPLTVKTNDRFVTFNDFMALASGYSDTSNGTIVKAGVIADPTDGLSNLVSIYVWGQDDKSQLVEGASQALKNSLQSFVNDRKVVTVAAEVKDGTNVPVDIKARIVIASNYNAEEVRLKVDSELKKMFIQERIRYGNELRGSWIYETVQDIPGVRWTQITHCDGTNSSPYDPDDTQELEDYAQHLYEENVRMSQTTAASKGFRINVPGVNYVGGNPDLGYTPWGYYGVDTPEDYLNSFWIVDVSVNDYYAANIQDYTAPSIGTLANPWLQIIDHYTVFIPDGFGSISQQVWLRVDRALPQGTYKSSYMDGGNLVGGFRGRIAHKRLMKLAANKVQTVGQYKYHTIHIIDGTGKGQERTILDSYAFDNPSNMMRDTVLVDKDWVVFPDITSKYVIMPNLMVPQDRALTPGNIEVEILKNPLTPNG